MIQDAIQKAIEQIDTARRALPATHFNHIARELNLAIETLRGLKSVQAAIVTKPPANPHKTLEPMDDLPGVRVIRKGGPARERLD